jgi:hypothetical protein
MYVFEIDDFISPTRDFTVRPDPESNLKNIFRTN